MPLTQTPFIAYFAINRGPNGWSEAWHLPEPNIEDARRTVILLADARSYILAQGCQLEWAAARLVVNPYIEWSAIADPLQALPQWGPVDSDRMGLLWRFQTRYGRWANHLFRGIEDEEISNANWTRAPFALPGGPVPRPADPGTATKADLFRYVFALFRDRTCHARDLDPGNPAPHNWELTPWEDAIYRKVSSRAWGSKYHRVSWEPRDFGEQPGFTPCGTVVTVLRSCYEQDCRFFSAGPVQGIRYYNAAPGAGVFPFQTIFWGWQRDKEIPDGVTPGESKSRSTWGYSLGLAWGVAPGIAPDGTQEQFLGRTVCPWGSSPTTPDIYRIECDVPSPIPITLDDDPLTITVANVTHLTVDGVTATVTQVSPGHGRISFHIVATLSDASETDDAAQTLVFDSADFGLDTTTPGEPVITWAGFTVQESDGSPTVAGVKTIEVNVAQGLRVVDAGGGVVELQLDPTIFGMRDINAWRQMGAVGLDRSYFAGVNTDTYTDDWSADANRLYALPLLASAGGVIDEISVEVTVPGNGTTVTPAVAGQGALDFYPIWGSPRDSLDSGNAFGHYVTQAYGDLPGTFPDRAGAVFLRGSVVNAAPKLAVHFAERLPWPPPAEPSYPVAPLSPPPPSAWLGSRFRIGIYRAASQTDLYPGELLVDSGELDGSTLGMKAIPVNLTLYPGQLYWMVLLASQLVDEHRLAGGVALGGPLEISLPFGIDLSAGVELGGFLGQPPLLELDFTGGIELGGPLDYSEPLVMDLTAGVSLGGELVLTLPDDADPDHWWRFDEGSGSESTDYGVALVPSDAENITGWTTAGLPTTIPDNVAAAVLDGIQEIQFGTLTLGDPFTLMGRVKFAAEDLPLPVFGTFAGTGVAHVRIVAPSEDPQLEFFRPSTADMLTGSAPMAEDTWHHWAVRRHGDNIDLFVDGDLAGSGSFPALATGSADYVTGLPGGLIPTCEVDDIRLYGGYLSNRAIAGIANPHTLAGGVSLGGELEGVYSHAHDLSGGVELGGELEGEYEDIGGGGGTPGSLSFDGTDDYVTLPDLDNGNDWTIAMRIKPARSAPQDGILVGDTGSAFLAVKSPFIPLWQGGVHANWPGKTNYTQNAWHSVVLAYRASDQRMTLYVNADGSPADQSGWGALSSSGNYTLGAPFAVASAPSQYFQGKITDIRVFEDRELSSSDVTAYHNGGVLTHADTTAAYDMIAWYKFTEGTGTTLGDSSGNANHGTISGASWDADVP